ncbi:MAG: carboxypeptidase-like regulatory domain-containing protein [Pirellula sp.]
MNQKSLLVFAVVAIGLLLGCGDSSDGPKTVNASGVLTLDGSPVKEAQVVFVDVTGVPAYATTDANGKFSMMVSDTKKGAVPGTYPVIVSKTKMEDLGGGSVKLEQGLPAQYGDPAKSGISVEVPATGTNSIKIELVSSAKKSK